MAQGETAKDVAKMSFEDAMRALEDIVGKLESGEATLEESIALYERGAALKAHCDKRLKDAELRVEKIVQGADGATAGTAPLDVDAAPERKRAPAAKAAPAAKPGDDLDDDIPF